MPRHNATCQRCGATFYAPPVNVRNGGGKFCSLVCRDGPLEERFFRYVNKTASCWIWVGGKFRRGYGEFTVSNRPRRAHRVSWELHNGPIPDGLHVLHNCPGGDNPACVNPAHLWLGTNEENMADMVLKGRAAHGLRNGRGKLTDEQIEAIKARYAAGKVSQQSLGVEYGISQAHVSRIVLGVGRVGSVG